MKTSKDIQSKLDNRKELIFLVVVFSAPFVAAWLIYNHMSLVNIGDSSNYGDPISPPRLIPDLTLTGVVAGRADAQLYGKWSLIYLLSDSCSRQCQDNIRMLRNLRASLGSNSDRIQAVLALKNPASSELTKKLATDFNWNGIFMVDREDLSAAEENSLDLKEIEPALESGFYLVDPLGNMMMRYKIDSDGAGIMTDLKRLLRYSRIG